MNSSDLKTNRIKSQLADIMTNTAQQLSDTITLSSTNTQILTGQIYASNGSFQTNASFDTLYFPIDKYISFLLSNYSGSAYGGAFVDINKNWISSFATDGTNANIVKTVPTGAYYIAISVPTSGIYKTITGYYNISVPKVNSTLLSDAQIITQQASDVITLNFANTQMLTGQIYTSTGAFQTNASFDTLYFPVGKYTSFLLSNYVIGVYGGAFVDINKNWISSFSTNGTDANITKNVPNGAYYIGISVSTSAIYKSITGYYNINYYQLNNLFVNPATQFNGGLKNNQWYGKNVVWIGTSVSFGQYATASYAVEASNKLGFNLINASVPGEAIHTNSDGSPLTYGSTTLSKAEYIANGTISIDGSPIPYVAGGSYNNYYRTWENIFTSANANADLWVFDVVPNNTNFATTDWTAFDTTNWKYNDNSAFSTHRTTFLGALLFLMDKMYALNPNARMVFVLGSSFAYSSGKTALNLLSSQWNIPIIDIWSGINTSPKSITQIVNNPTTNNHPSTFGHQKLGNILANELLLIS